MLSSLQPCRVQLPSSRSASLYTSGMPAAAALAQHSTAPRSTIFGVGLDRLVRSSGTLHSQPFLEPGPLRMGRRSAQPRPCPLARMSTALSKLGSAPPRTMSSPWVLVVARLRCATAKVVSIQRLPKRSARISAASHCACLGPSMMWRVWRLPHLTKLRWR